jgi:hypothetical protein
MKGKKSSRKSRRPDIICCFIEKQKQKDNSADVEEQTYKVMPSGICSEKAPVQHMGNQSQRMPIAADNSREHKINALAIDSRLYLIIFCEVYIVIKINEIIACYPANGGAGNNN